jgi:hypothetical protein
MPTERGRTELVPGHVDAPVGGHIDAREELVVVRVSGGVVVVELHPVAPLLPQVRPSSRLMWA